MEPRTELNRSFTMSFHSVSAKQGHFGSSTEYIAESHKVVYRTWGARRRCFGLLPPKQIPPEVRELAIPKEIITEDALWEYVRHRAPHWLHGAYRRKPGGSVK